MRDIDGLLKENARLKESQGLESLNSLHQTRERIQSHLYKTQKVLGVAEAKLLGNSPGWPSTHSPDYIGTGLVRQQPVHSKEVSALHDNRSNRPTLDSNPRLPVMEPEDFESEMLSDEESEPDPSKVNVAVSTILLSFDKSAGKNQRPMIANTKQRGYGEPSAEKSVQDQINDKLMMIAEDNDEYLAREESASSKSSQLGSQADT